MRQCSWCFAIGEPMTGETEETLMCLDDVACTKRATVLLEDVLRQAQGVSR